MKSIIKIIPSFLGLTTCVLFLLLVFTLDLRCESQTTEDIYIPKNLEETFIELKRILPSNDLKTFKESSENEIYNFHFSIGMGLRNRWGLWSESRLAKYFNSIGIFHPDDMSGIIIKSFWRHLNNKSMQLEKQIEYYQEFWKYNIPAEDAVSPIDGSPIRFISSHKCKDLTISKHCSVHFGVSKSDGSPWAYQYGKGVYEPSDKDKKKILQHVQQIINNGIIPQQ